MEKYAKIFEILEKSKPNASCELDFKTPFELLVAVILSAQCTDKRVNIVTKELYKVADTAEKIVEMDILTLEKYIMTCGFYKVKASNIKAAASRIVTEYNGNLPDTFDGLLSLAGVGRKTANVIMAEIYNYPSIAVDTHVFRVSHRLDLSNANTPDGVEIDLKKLFPREQWIKLHHLLIHHGRYICKAVKPMCKDCPLIVVGLCGGLK